MGFNQETKKKSTRVHKQPPLYHPGISSLLELAGKRVRKSLPVEFEYCGAIYLIKKVNTDEKAGKWELLTLGAAFEYLSPTYDRNPDDARTITEFDGDKYEDFISTFRLGGKTIQWILDHQRVWRYRLTAEHFENVLTGFSFTFFYRMTPCRISGGQGERCFSVIHGVQFDPSQYAPKNPEAGHWFAASWDLGIFSPSRVWVSSGPFRTDSELLDTVRFNYEVNGEVIRKTLRELFDTEYDDGEVFCGMFEG